MGPGRGYGVQSRRGPAPQPVLQRLMRHIEPEPNSGCWLWMAQTVLGGYGRTQIGVQVQYARAPKVLAHRAMWMEVHGPIPAGLDVMHRCDVPPCVNPAHLTLGTRRDNIQDAIQKGRKNPRAQMLARWARHRAQEARA